VDPPSLVSDKKTPYSKPECRFSTRIYSYIDRIRVIL
jgi:hypothetical protein